MGISKTRRPLWKELRRRLALFLSVALIGGNLGLIAPRAETTTPDKPVILKIRELPESVLVQDVSIGTPEKDLNFPDTLEVSTATDSDADRASSSDALWDGWEQVPVDWRFFFADNGEDHYNGEVEGTYFFEADLTGTYPVAGHVELPIISVNVSELAGLEDGEIIWEFIDLGDTLTSVEPSISLFSASNGRVDLASGNHIEWIDRVALPSYAKDLYDRLVEGSDNDGVDDILIDSRYFSSSTAVTVGSARFNGFEVYQTTKSSQMSKEEENYILASIRTAFDAFDRDHPEVFWLSGSTYAFSSTQQISGGYRYTFYFPLKTHSGFKYNFDIRASLYQSESRIKSGIRTRENQIDAILDTVTGEDAADQIVQLDQWLTTHNEYNTTKGDYPWESRECITALVGNTGTDGPVCEGYARAFNVLCDRLGIPCVLVNGQAGGGGHMWNYAQVDGKWYAVDTTWDDPVNGNPGAISGRENTNWLLLGSNTMVKEGNQNKTFINSHPASNTVSEAGGVGFTNGPVLNRDRYPLKPIPKVTFSSSSRTVTYTGQAATVPAPTIIIKKDDGTSIEPPVPTYSYQRSGSSVYTNGLPTNAGTYTIRAQVPATDNYFSASGYMTLVIQKSKPTLSVSSSYGRPKTYDGTPYAVPSTSQVAVTGASYGNVKFTWYKNSVSGSNRLSSAPSDAGTYVLVSSIDETENTQAVSTDTAVTINRRRVSVAADPAGKSYGDPDPVLTWRFTGDTSLVGSDSLKGNLSRQSGEDVGSYTINQGTLGSDSNPNYEITFQPGTFTIRKAARIQAPEASAVTDTTVDLKPVELGSGGGTVEYGYAAGDSLEQVSWQGGNTRFSNLTPGTTYYFFARVSGSTNYEDSWNSKAVTTKKTAVPVPAAGERYVYSGNQITVNITGYNQELMTQTGTTSGTDAGDYSVQFQLKDTARYAWQGQPDNTSAVTVTWRIEKKPVTVTAADKRRTVNKDNPELTLVALEDGVLAGDDTIEDLGVTLSTNAQKNSPAGTYQITGTASPDTNYQVTIIPGTLTISRSSGSSGGGGGGGSSSGGGGGGGGSSSGGGGGGGSSTKAATTPSPSSTSGFWNSDSLGWRFLTSSGSYATGRRGVDSQGNAQEYISWHRINNVWWAFGADSYAKEGWVLDASTNLWYNVDINSGMRTNWYLDNGDGHWYFLDPASGHMLVGWQLVNGVWYYLNPVSQAGRPYGAMYCNERTPDGYFVKADGSWTGQ